MKEFQIGPCRLIHGDCRKLLGDMPDKSIQCIVTSPPYNQVDPKKMKSPSGMLSDPKSGRSWIKKFEKFGYADDMPEEDYRCWVKEIVGICLEKCDGLVWVNHKTRYRNKEAIHPLSFLPYPLYSEVIWDRRISITLNSNRYAPSHEYFFGFGTPKVWDKKANRRMSVWMVSPEGNKKHACSFPVRLVSRLIEDCTESGMLVCDPFMGSGSTGVACIRTGRDFVGMEINEDHFNSSCERIESEWKKHKSGFGLMRKPKEQASFGIPKGRKKRK